MVRLTWLLIGAVALGGCDLGDDSGSSTGIPARAAASAERLSAREREAAQALVMLESAARERDGEMLCQSVYVFAGGPSPGCRDTMKKLFAVTDGFSVTVRSVRFTSPRHAFAKAGTATVDKVGAVQRFPDSTFELALRDGVWRVMFQT